jgi:membrane-anchored glycerophosphoryl diester phosphodiesterase (GDPDase)
MDIGEVLTRAWRIIWKFKVLWIFGILSSCAVSGTGPRSEFQMSNQDPWFRDFPNYNFQPSTGLIVAAIVLGIVLIALVIILGTYGRIGVARGTWRADEGEQRLTFGELWNQSSPYFWRVIGMQLLIFLIGLFIFVLVAIPFAGGLFMSQGAGGPLPNWALIPFVPLIICLICLLVPVSWAVSVIVEQAIVAIVGDDLSISQALSRGWQVVRTSPGMMILMALILYVGRGIVSFILALPLVAIVTPVAAALFFQSQRGGMNMGVTIVAAVLFVLIALPVYLLINGIIQTYIGASWTLTYRRLTQRLAGSSPTPPVEVTTT